MGWGTAEHEGYAEEKRPDGRWSRGTRHGGDPDAVASRAACSCGWRSEREHAVAPRPTEVPRDEQGLPNGPAWEAWVAALEAVEEACREDWNAEHFEPMLGYEPHQHLVLGRDDGGRRYFLDGRPVHAGAELDLLLADGHWLRVRFEWSWHDARSTAHVALGAPPEAQRQGVQPTVAFELAPRAVLRWPIDGNGRSPGAG